MRMVGFISGPPPGSWGASSSSFIGPEVHPLYDSAGVHRRRLYPCFSLVLC